MPSSFTRLLIPLAAVVSLVGACGEDGAAAGSTIDVSLADDAVTLSDAEASSGTLTFSATNDGTLTHEIEVFEGEKDHRLAPHRG